MYFFLSFFFFLSLLLLTLQPKRKTIVCQSLTQRATHKWKMKNKDEQVIFLSPPLKKSEKQFLFWVIFLKVWNSQRIEPFVFYITSKCFSSGFFFVWWYLFSGVYTRSSTPRCQFHPVVSSSCVKSELALIINQYHKQTTITYIEKINTLHAL